jgi:CheY-like chemotaxis protein
VIEGEGHAVLIVEDDEVVRDKLAAFVRSRGERPFLATCVRRALEMLATLHPCYVLADHQLPMEDGDDPFEESGEYLLREARKLDMRVVPGTLFCVLQIIVVTALPPETKFVTRMLHLGASHFLSKPLGREQLRELSVMIDECLERSRRVHHSACAAHARGGPSPEPEPKLTAAPRIRIDGARARTRVVIFVDGHRRTIQESAMVPLLRAIVVHERSPGMYSPKEYLRISPSGSATTRIREPFKGLVPEGFEVLEGSGGGAFRLNPALVVEHVDWVALAQHTNLQIKKIAKEQCDRLRLPG